jgi:putative DNA primase/helicase
VAKAEPIGEFGKGVEDYKQAEWLAQRLRKKWRYDHTAEKWHHWDGVRWALDDQRRIHREVARVAGVALGKGGGGEGEVKRLNELLKWPVQERVLKALATLDGYGTNGDDWDATPYYLGCANGIVDLRKNELIDTPTPDMLVTKSTLVKFVPVASPADFATAAPEFMRSIGEWMTGDDTMVAFLLLWFGASLFGFTPEQRFLLMTGVGRNGKGALKHSVLRAVGEYGAQSTPTCTCGASSGAPGRIRRVPTSSRSRASGSRSSPSPRAGGSTRSC